MESGQAGATPDPVNCRYLLAPSKPRREDGAAVDWPSVDQHRARAALGPVAPQVGARQVEPIDHGFPEALAYIDGHRSRHAVDVQVDTSLAQRQRSALRL